MNRILERISSFGKIKKIQKNGLFYEYRWSPIELKNFVLTNTPFKRVSLYGCQNINRKIINKLGWLKNIDITLSDFYPSIYLGYYFIAVLEK